MAKSSYIGIDNKARKIKKWYVGVDGKARKVKKAYIGVGGVARPFLTGDEVTYYGTVDDLSEGKLDFAAASVGNYALFAGGRTYPDSTYSSVVNAYNSSLIRSTPAKQLYTKAARLSGASNNNYALFAGGDVGSYKESAYVTAYDSSLTFKNPAALSQKATSMAGGTVGDYALFAGGYYASNTSYGTTSISYVNAYNLSLTKTTSTLTVARENLSSATINNYVLFAGGIQNGTFKVTVETFNSTLTRSTATDLSAAKHDMGGASVGDYALFAGGIYYNESNKAVTTNVVECYNKSIVKTTSLTLSETKMGLAGVSSSKFAIFAGGYNRNSSSVSSSVDIFDTNLTRSTLTLSQGREDLEAATTGKYALFAGGSYGPSIVDAFVLT